MSLHASVALAVLNKPCPWFQQKQGTKTGTHTIVLYILRQSPPHLGSPFIAQALFSLMMAESKDLSKLHRKPMDWGPMIHWSCEKDSACQKVLTSTYPGCCFTDVKDVKKTTGKSTAYCITHGTQCPAHVEKAPGRCSTYNLGGVECYVNMFSKQNASPIMRTSCLGQRVRIAGQI